MCAKNPPLTGFLEQIRNFVLPSASLYHFGIVVGQQEHIIDAKAKCEKRHNVRRGGVEVNAKASGQAEPGQRCHRHEQNTNERKPCERVDCRQRHTSAIAHKTEQ
jgi:hypothetical protein